MPDTSRFTPRAPTPPTSLYQTLLLATTPEGLRVYTHLACRHSHRPVGHIATHAVRPDPTYAFTTSPLFILAATSGGRPLDAERPDRTCVCADSRALRVPRVIPQQSRTCARERQLRGPNKARQGCVRRRLCPRRGLVLLAPVDMPPQYLPSAVALHVPAASVPRVATSARGVHGSSPTPSSSRVLARPRVLPALAAYPCCLPRRPRVPRSPASPQAMYSNFEAQALWVCRRLESGRNIANTTRRFRSSPGLVNTSPWRQVSTPGTICYARSLGLELV